jgi:hypothetical protein
VAARRLNGAMGSAVAPGIHSDGWHPSRGGPKRDTPPF